MIWLILIFIGFLLLRYLEVIEIQFNVLNIPTWQVVMFFLTLFLFSLFYIRLTRCTKRKSLFVIGVDSLEKRYSYLNVGAMFIPVAFLILITNHGPYVPTLITFLVALSVGLVLASRNKKKKLYIPFLVVILLSISLALFLSPVNPGPVMFISGVMSLVVIESLYKIMNRKNRIVIGDINYLFAIVILSFLSQLF